MARTRGYDAFMIFPKHRNMSALEKQHRQIWHDNNLKRIAEIDRYLSERGVRPAVLGG